MHPERKTPVVALAIQTLISAVLGLVLAGVFGPDKIFILSVGFCLVLAVIFTIAVRIPRVVVQPVASSPEVNKAIGSA